MKKIISLCLSLAMMLTVFTATSLTAQAEEYEKTIDGITYSIDAETSEAWVFGADKSITTANILSEVDGCKVIAIGDYAFRGCASLVEVTIPDSVTYIYDRAFWNCTSLTAVTIPDSVTGISNWAFQNCTSLAKITIPDSVMTIRINPFDNTAYYNDNANWENGVLYIDNCLIVAQKYYEENKDKILESEVKGDYKIKDGTRLIADSAFKECTSLTAVTIPDSVKKIGDCAFWDCTSLTKITISDSVKSIGYMVFDNTGYYNDATNWENGVLYIGNCLIDAQKYYYDENFDKVVELEVKGDYKIKDGTRLIADSAFEDCTLLTTVTIPNSVTTIGGATFEYCESLTSVTLPDSITSISEDAFGSCKSLTTVTIPNSVTSIGRAAFFECLSLTSFTITNSITDIGNYAFFYCTSLATVTIPDNVTSIGYMAFYDCKSLTTVTIPDSVTSIGDYAFGYDEDEDWNTQKIENFTIQGYKGSVAETYANENEFAFISLGQSQQLSKGDANGDGKVSVADARKLIVAIAKGQTDELLEFGDVNNDGKISVADARKIVVAIAKNDFNF